MSSALKYSVSVGIIILHSFNTFSQSKVLIKSGAYWVQNGAPRLVLKDISFDNSGNFATASGRLIMRGSTPNSNSSLSLGGSLYELEVDKSPNGILLTSDLTILNQLILTSGNLDLGAQKLTLQNATIIGENSTNYITGTTGEVELTMSVNAPTLLDPGNVGLQLSSGQNLGSTTFTRGHDPQTDGTYSGINRYYTINPSNNSGLNATFRMYYFDAELNGMLENDLEFYKFDGSQWSKEGVSTRNTTENWVELTAINAFSTWTLSSSANPLPIELISFEAASSGNRVQLVWRTLTETNNAYFTLERSKDASQWEEIMEVTGAVNSSELLSYEAIDYHPYMGVSYYRLKQTDFDGQYSYSQIVLVNSGKLANNLVRIYPNPTTNELTIEGNEIELKSLEVFNMLGQDMMTKIMIMARRNDQLTLNLRNLPVGLYTIKTNTSSTKVYRN